MRYLIASLFIASIAGGWVIVAQDKKAPAKLVFEAKTGNITYDHAAHVKREKNNCKVCHDKIFPQSKAPLGFKGGMMHATAVKDHTSCGFCHHPGGKSFEPKGNCNKCHVKGGAKG